MGTPVWWGWFLLFSRSGGHKTKETYPTRPGSPTPCKQALRKTSIQKCEIAQNCRFPLPFLTVIAFHRVQKSPLITGIVDRIRMNSEQPFPFSESELLIPYFLPIAGIIYVCFVYFAAIALVWINLHRQHVFCTVML